MVKSAITYGLYDGGNIIGFLAVNHFPHPINKRIKKCHRLVILPDYQGIGLGSRFLDFVSDMYVREGYDFAITTSMKNLAGSLKRNDKWILTSAGKSKSKTAGIKSFLKTRRTVNTYSFYRKR